MKHSEVVLVVPALNEEENLDWLLPQLMNWYTVVLVDNGSTDGTPEVARRAGAIVLSHPIKGYGGAVLKGFRHIQADPQLRRRTEAVVVFDADGTSPAEAIPELAGPVVKGLSDLTIGQRVTKEQGAMPIHANFGNWLQTFLIGIVTGRKYLDMGPMRALSVDAIDRLEMRDPTWGWNVEMQMKAAFLKMRITELPIRYKKRVFGHSKISGSLWGSVKAGVKIIYAVFLYALIGFRLKKKASAKQRLMVSKSNRA